MKWHWSGDENVKIKVLLFRLLRRCTNVFSLTELTVLTLLN